MEQIASIADRYAEFGGTEIVMLSKIQKLTGEYLSRNWSSIPHVTHHDEADVTALEALRADLMAKHSNPRITSVALHVKAIVAALRRFPKFNASLDERGEALILKKYFNIGIAVDTPRGLMVPVIRDADRKPVSVIAQELAEKAAKARTKGLPMAEMSGGSFSLSSLGRNGGTGFTPLINAPEVAILGTSRLQEKPIRRGDGLAWITALPLSLSYDHRAINGAEAASFLKCIGELLANPSEAWIA
jgi:pyruvate dehydrogenase E2 component (dihydrolipoamide acetyltransferase)